MLSKKVGSGLRKLPDLWWGAQDRGDQVRRKLILTVGKGEERVGHPNVESGSRVWDTNKESTGWEEE